MKISIYPLVSFVLITSVLLGSMLTCSSAWGEDDPLEGDIKSQKLNLNKLKKEIRKNSVALREKRLKEKRVLTDIRRYAKRLRQLNHELLGFQSGLLKNEKDKITILKKINRIHLSLETRKALLSKRLRAIYKDRTKDYLKYIPLSGIIPDDIIRKKLLDRIARYDARLIRVFNDKLKKLKASEKRLAEIESRIHLYKKRVLTKKREITALKAEKEDILKGIFKRKEYLSKVKRELEERRSRIKQLIASLYKKKRGNLNRKRAISNFIKKKGELLWPLYGNLLSRFGRVRDKNIGVFLTNNGINISAGFGEKVKAVYGGTVIYANRLEGYGRVVIVDHGGFWYSLYGHLDDITVTVDDPVYEGQEIGNVGSDEGGLSRTLSLYFEIRHRGTPQDPVKWLAKK